MAPRHSVLGKTCSICLDPFSQLVPSRVLGLHCGHSCHWECYLLFMDSSDPYHSYPICEVCLKPSKPRSAQDRESLIEAALAGHDSLEDVDPLFLPGPTLLLPILPVLPVLPVLPTPKGRFVNDSRRSSRLDDGFLAAPDLPQVTLEPELELVSLLELTTVASIPSLLHINMPERPESQVSEEEMAAERCLRAEIAETVKQDWLPKSKAKETIAMFDVLEVEDAPGSWEPMGCFLMVSGALVFSCLSDRTAPGLVRKEDFAGVSRDHDQLTIHTTSIDLPEINMRDQSLIVLTKWERVLLEPIVPELPILQFLTNGWSLVRPQLVLADARHLQELFEAQLTIPEPLAVQLVPASQVAPMRVVLCVLMLSQDPEQRKAVVADLASEALASMDPTRDRLGVVYIYRHGSKTSLSFLANITDPKQIHESLMLLPCSENAFGCLNLEQQALFLELAVKLVEFWGDCRDQKNTLIRKMVMVLDGGELSQDNGVSFQDKVYNKTVKTYLKRTIREYCFLLHVKLLPDSVDSQTVRFVLLLARENYRTHGQEFRTLSCLSNLLFEGMIAQWRRITVPRIKIELRNMGLEVTFSVDEISNCGASFDIYEEPEPSSAGSISLPSLPYDSSFDFVYGYSPIVESEEYDTASNTIVVNDLCAGDQKSLLLHIQLSLTHAKRQSLKNKRRRLLLIEMAVGKEVSQVSVEVALGSVSEDVLARQSTLSEISLPVFPQPLAAHRNHLYAKRQMLLAVASSLLDMMREIQHQDLEKAARVLLELESNIHALARNCVGGTNELYVNYLSYVINGAVNLLRYEGQDMAFLTAFESACSLWMQ